MFKLDAYIAQYQKMSKHKGYDETVPLVKEIEQFLIEQLVVEPCSTQFILTLASVRYELSLDMEHSVDLIQQFLLRYDSQLSNVEKERIYLNLAYYYRDMDMFEGEFKMLKKAESYALNSPYLNYGLGLNYFDREDYQKAEYYFSRLVLLSDFTYNYCYAVALYTNGRYAQAKEQFKLLLDLSSDRQKLKLEIAYCDAKLGNKQQALSVIETIDLTLDYMYIDADIYYSLHDYAKCILIWQKMDQKPNVLIDRLDYFYALHHQGQLKKFEELSKAVLNYMQLNLETIKQESITKDYSKSEKFEDIQYQKEQIIQFEQTIDAIANKSYRPKDDLIIFPEYRCYMPDCIKHQNIESI